MVQRAVPFVLHLPESEVVAELLRRAQLLARLVKKRLRLRRERLHGARPPVGPRLFLERRDLCANLRRLLLPHLQRCGMVLALDRSRSGHVVAPEHRLEKRPQPVIVALKNRVELVVVTLRATHAEPHEHIAGHIGDFVHDRRALPRDVAIVVFVNRRAEEPRRRERPRIAGPQFVGGELLLHEPVIRHVRIERLDHIVAIPPRGGPVIIGLISVGLRVAHQVQPVPRPPLAVTR